MGRVLAGEDTLEVLAGAWAAAETFGWEIRRLGVLGADFRPLVFDGLFLQLPISSVDALRCAYATVLIREANYRQADELLSRPAAPSDPFDADMPSYVSGLLHFRTQRWTDVLRLFPVDKRWYRAEYECAATAMATTALASLGVFEDAFRRGEKAAGDDRVPQAATVILYTQAMCLRHLGREDEAAQLLRRVYSRDPKFAPAREAMDDPTRRLVLTDPETIEARTDPWDPASAPSRAGDRDGPRRREGLAVFGRGASRARRDAGHEDGQTGNQTHPLDHEGQPGALQGGAAGAGDLSAHVAAGSARDRKDLGGKVFHQAAVRAQGAAQTAGGGDQPREAAGPLHG